MTPDAPQRGGPSRSRLLRAFAFALAGLGHLFRTQRNARIELAIGAAAVVLGLLLRITPIEWAVLVLTIALVLGLEAVNTAIEAAVDLASPEQHQLAKTAKDVAAAAVLIASIASVVVGLLVFS